MHASAVCVTSLVITALSTCYSTPINVPVQLPETDSIVWTADEEHDQQIQEIPKLEPAGEEFFNFDVADRLTKARLNQERTSEPSFDSDWQPRLFISKPAKRWPNSLSMISKRIHACAFMRRLGLPIGLCFRKPRPWTGHQEKSQPEPDDNADVYAYLARQWPVHSMLGGAVGR